MWEDNLILTVTMCFFFLILTIVNVFYMFIQTYLFVNSICLNMQWKLYTVY